MVCGCLEIGIKTQGLVGSGRNKQAKAWATNITQCKPQLGACIIRAKTGYRLKSRLQNKY